MIPLDSTTAILPRMPTGRSITGEFPLTIIKPPALDVKSRSSPSAISSPIYRLVRSSNQRRNSSASSLRSSCNTKPECKEFVTERVEVFELKDTVRHSHVESLLLQCENQDTCTFPSNIGMCQEKTPYSRRNGLISSAKDRRISIQDNPLGKEKMNVKISISRVVFQYHDFHSPGGGYYVKISVHCFPGNEKLLLKHL